MDTLGINGSVHAHPNLAPKQSIDPSTINDIFYLNSIMACYNS